MNIGDVSKATGLSAKMIRYYETIGLIESPRRTAAGYRVYGDNDVHTLHFIRRARDLGFSVAQMGDLLALWRDRSRSSAEVKEIALRHVRELEEKAKSLREMADTLALLARHCHGDSRPSCPILDELASLSTP
jgi:MerR family copper efflux transcriptional regulator